MEFEIGRVTHYYNHLQVAVLMLKGMLMVGDRIHICGHMMDLTQLVTSMEINHTRVVWALPGGDVALQVIGLVHTNDKVYRMAIDKPDMHAT